MESPCVVCGNLVEHATITTREGTAPNPCPFHAAVLPRIPSTLQTPQLEETLSPAEDRSVRLVQEARQDGTPP
jgi:hypothetical protein